MATSPATPQGNSDYTYLGPVSASGPPAQSPQGSDYTYLGPATSTAAPAPIPPSMTVPVSPATPKQVQSPSPVVQPPAAPPIRQPVAGRGTGLDIRKTQQVLDDYSAGKQIITKAAGGAAKAAVASLPAASGLPSGPQSQEFARLTAEDLTNFGQGAAPYMLGGEVLGSGISAMRLAPWVGRGIQVMVSAGYSYEQAKIGANYVAQYRDVAKRFGPTSPQALDALKGAGMNFGMAFLGTLSIAHGAATVYGEQKAKAMFQADPDAFAAAEAAMRKGVNPEQMKTPHGKAQAKATFDQAYSEAGGPEVKPDIIGGIKNAFSGKKPAPAQQPIAQLPPQEVPNAQPNAQQAQPTPVPVSAQAGSPEVAGVPPKGTVVQATPEGGKVAVAPAQPQAPRPAPGIPQVVAPQGPSTPVVAGQPPAPVEGSTGNVYNETRAEELPEKGNLQVRQPSADRSTGLRGVPPAVGSPIQGSAQEAQPAAASTSKDNTLPLREPPAQPNAEVLPGVQERGTTQNQPQVQGLSSGGKGQGGVPIVQPSIGQAGQNTPATMQGLRGAEGGNAPSSIPQFPSSGVGVPSVPPEAPPVPAAHQAILEAGGINPRPWEAAGMLIFEDPQTRSTLSIPASTPDAQVAGLVRDKIAESRKAYAASAAPSPKTPGRAAWELMADRLRAQGLSDTEIATRVRMYYPDAMPAPQGSLQPPNAPVYGWRKRDAEPEEAPQEVAAPAPPAASPIAPSVAAPAPARAEAAPNPPPVVPAPPQVPAESPPVAAAPPAARPPMTTGVPAPGAVGRMAISDISTDPERFQYKLGTGEGGVTNKLKDVQKYNPEFGGVISVWTDPADGKTYVVNGHHRLELAQRVGEKEIDVRSIEAADAEEARSIGALVNIAEGQGTPVDAAKFFRDSGLTVEDLKSSGIRMGEAVARKGLALARLDDPIFQMVATGNIPVGRAVAIGEATADQAQQWGILKMIGVAEGRGKTVSDGMVSEIARFVKEAGQTASTQESLFGTQEISRSHALEKAEISSYVKERFAKDRKLFGFVAKGTRAAELARGGNQIDREASQKISSEAAQLEELYNRLSTGVGPVSAALNRAAAELATGKEANAIKEAAYYAIREAILQAFPGSQAAGSPASGRGAATGESTGPGDNSPDNGYDYLGVVKLPPEEAARVNAEIEKEPLAGARGRGHPFPAQRSLFGTPDVPKGQLGLNIPGMENTLKDAARIERERMSQLGLWEKAENPAVKVEPSDLRGSSGGQKDLTIQAKDSTGRVVGVLNYSLFNDQAHIGNIEVAPEFQRQGIATQMWSQLKNDNPGIPINPGYATESGAKFLGAVEGEQPKTFKEALANQNQPAASAPSRQKGEMDAASVEPPQDRPGGQPVAIDRPAQERLATLLDRAKSEFSHEDAELFGEAVKEWNRVPEYNAPESEWRSFENRDYIGPTRAADLLEAALRQGGDKDALARIAEWLTKEADEAGMLSYDNSDKNVPKEKIHVPNKPPAWDAPKSTWDEYAKIGRQGLTSALDIWDEERKAAGLPHQNPPWLKLTKKPMFSGYDLPIRVEKPLDRFIDQSVKRLRGKWATSAQDVETQRARSLPY